MRVVIIPEDFRNDQYILKPLVEAMLAAAGRPRARVTVCRDPVVRGVGQALDRDVLAQILERYSGMTDLFLLCVDRDGVASRRHALEALEAHAAGLLSPGQVLLGENAWQELEVWVLAGQTDLPGSWDWKAIRAEVDPKEKYYEPYAHRRGMSEQVGGGRKILAEEAARRYQRVRSLCPEDVQHLEARITNWIQSGALSEARTSKLPP